VILFLPAALRARSLAALASLGLLLWLTVESPRSSAPPTAPHSLRLVVWNVASNPGFAEQLQAFQPDIALVQEAARPAVLPPGYTWHETFDPGVLSRLPIETLPTRPIGPWTPPQVLLATLPDGRRVLLANVRLVLPTPIVQLASFPSDLGPETHRARVEQFPRLRRLLEETAKQRDVDAVVLAGDFNTPGGARSLDGLKPLLRDVWPEAGRGWGATAPAFLPLSRIDQCWTSEGVRPVHAEVVRLPGSDHRMLLVDLAFYTPPRNEAPRR
jgi:endonuclease/exonuclease/phosphatase (EEP) superfamily protein YafD